MYQKFMPEGLSRKNRDGETGSAFVVYNKATYKVFVEKHKNC